MLRVLYFTVFLVLATGFVWYVWHVINDTRAGRTRTNSQKPGPSAPDEPQPPAQQ